MGSSFKEIEHKFVVDDSFDRKSFFEGIERLKPTRTEVLEVEDTYFILQNSPAHVFRHRFDREIEQLTVKTVEDNPECRTEINLNLSHGSKHQLRAVHAFLGVFGAKWTKTLRKDLAVAYFDDCEIVHYCAESSGRRVNCVEFEAIGTDSLEEGRQILAKYEEKLGFGSKERSDKTLLELLLLVDAPEDVKTMFR